MIERISNCEVLFLFERYPNLKKHIKKEELAKVKELDLLSYFINYEPDELVKISRNVYSTRTHGSLKISNGMWTWWAHNIGGKSALDYFIKVKGYEFLEAALYLNDCIQKNKPIITNVNTNSYSHDKEFKLPTPNGNNDRIIQYLCEERCIDREIVNYCIKHYDLYESKNDHSVIFVGYNAESRAKYASKRSIEDNEKRDIAGSNKRFGFSLSFGKLAKRLHVFEGAIDLLSYITILKQQGIDWQCDDYLSLGNASLLGKNKSDVSLPVALEEYLYRNDEIKSLYLHLDNDKAGHDTTERIKIVLKNQYDIFDKTPKGVNDINEYLIYRTSRSKSNEQAIER